MQTKNGVNNNKTANKPKEIFSFLTKEAKILSKIMYSDTLSDKNEIDQLEGILAYKTIDHEIVSCNTHFLSYIGYKTEKNLIGKTDHDLVWNEYTPIYHEQENEALNKECYIALHPGKDIDGRDFLWLNRKFPWMDYLGNVIGIISYSIEIKKTNSIHLGVMLRNTAIANPTGIHYYNKATEINLSKRESECLFFLTRGKSSKHIAQALNLSVRTIENYIENLKIKFNCQNKFDLIDRAIEAGYVQIIPNSLLLTHLADALK